MADVVDCDISLLISKKEMKARALKLDLEHDILELNGEQIQLQTGPTGHYKLPSIRTEEVNVSDLINSDSKTQQRLVPKLHRQFYDQARMPSSCC